MKLKPEIRKKMGVLLFCMAVFVVMLVFFTVLHPIPIMDEDDVIYSVMVRKAIPLPGKWNPSRMMPEVLSALCGHLAALCAAMGLGRFIDCQVVLLGVMLSLFITAYVYSFFHLLEVRFDTGRFQAVCLSILFLLFHFLIFRTEASGNKHMFHTYDACCVFYYTISALLGCTLVLNFMAEPDGAPHLFRDHPVKESFLLLILYFALFSNLFGSAILAAYAVFRVLLNLRQAMQDRKRTHTAEADTIDAKEPESTGFLQRTAFWLGIVMVWMIAAVLELTGGRAAGTRGSLNSGELSVPAKFGQAVSLYIGRLWDSSLLFRLILAAVIVGILLSAIIRADRKENRSFLSALGEAALGGAMTALPVLLLCAGVDPTYAERPEVIFPLVFVLFLLMSIGIAFILRRVPIFSRTLPILLIFVFSMTNTNSLTFCDSNPLLINGHVAVAIENEIYESIIEAANSGETEVTVDVIRTVFGANWPHDGLIGDPIAQLFYKYGIIDHEIKVLTRPSSELNARYLLPVP